MKLKLNKQLIFGLFSAAIILLFGSCGFQWGWWIDDHNQRPDIEPIVFDSYSVQAGEDVNVALNFTAHTNESNTNKIIIAVQVPKVWNPREDGVIQITYENVTADPGVYKDMEIIPLGTSPVSKSGLTWEQFLLNRFGGDDPNVLDDMQWVAFISKESYTLDNTRWHYTARIKVKTGPENVKTKLGFCIYSENEGGREWDGDYLFYQIDWGDCLEVSGGEGDIVDFCELHFNQHTPGMANQNDIMTFRYIGDIATNDLMNAGEVFLNSVAITTDGRRIEINEKTDKTKLMKESEFGLTYSKTFWPEEYYGITSSEKISRIEYYFTNRDGDKYVSLYDDIYKDEPEENPTWTEKPINPFIFNFRLD